MKLKPQARKASPVFSKVSDMKRWFEMTDKNKKILEFREKFAHPIGTKALDHVLKGNLEYEPLESFLLSKLQEERENVIDEARAIIAVDIMGIELIKNRDLYNDGHLHGLKRALYLINHTLKSQEEHE